MRRIYLNLFSLLAGAFLLLFFAVEVYASEAHVGSGIGAVLPMWACLPFVGILLSIALGPLLVPHFWHKHYGKVSAFWAIVFALPFLLAFRGEALYHILHIYLIDYIPFIILLWALFTIAGGIVVGGTLRGTPAVNTAMLLVGTILCMKQLQPYRQAKKEWEKIRPLHTVRAYQSAIDGYDRLYPTLNYDPKFVFEYAVTLNAQEQREKADRVLTRGLQLSCDPMFFNVKGRNNHEMGKYKEAETCYIHSTYLLPERIYPYYLLTKLYADSANYQPAKMRLAARAVLEKEPKVHSTAINEMRDEVRKILKSKEVENER